MKTASSLAVVVAVLAALPAFGQDTTRPDFKKLCSDMQGRWIGDVTWITDWPGTGKKGERVTAYWRGTVTEDGNVLQAKFFGGNGSETSMIYFDPAAKRIRGLSVSSGGTVTTAIFYQKDGHWVQDVEVTLPDGKKGRLKCVGTITDGGNTWTWTMNGKIADDVIEDQRDTWRRVGKS